MSKPELTNIFLGLSLLFSSVLLTHEASAVDKAAKAKTATANKNKKGKKEKNMVELKTNMGRIVLKLNSEKAPISTKNFLAYVEKKHYDGTIFHRVIDGFMIQGGGMTADMKEKGTMDPIKNEADNGLKNKKYTVAMARTNVVDSATSQFFINVSDNDFLDFKSKNPQEYGYAVFGEVSDVKGEGREVVDKIRAVATGNNGMHQNVPTKAVVIESAKLL
jgi:peptidyl-prolyl cis-trans isomerase B (cyclophilin B)